MKFSTRDRYALRLMVELANRPNDLIPLKDISDKQRISLKYLEQIVTPLAKAGLVSSVRGAQGGYRLARPAGEITSGEILRAVEGELTAIPCLASSVDCPHRSQCHTLDFWSGLNDLINKYVDIVFANEEEAKAFTGKEPEEALDIIAKMCSIAIVKLGARGSIIRKGTDEKRVEAVPVEKVVDTTGAGDYFAAGFLYGLTCGYSLEKCARIGSLLSGDVIQVIGAELPEVQWEKIKKEISEL